MLAGHSVFTLGKKFPNQKLLGCLGHQYGINYVNYTI